MSESESKWGGVITTEMTVWCSRCVEWRQESTNGKRWFVKLIKLQGWRLKNKRWVCPKCLEKKPLASESKI